MIKGLLLLAGSVSLLLGIVGMVLPLIPATPFVLLSAYCFGRSGSRFHGWLMENRYFGEYVRNFHEGRGISLPQKISSITLLWLSLAYSAFYIGVPLWAKVLLLVVAVGVTRHLVRMPTLRRAAIVSLDADAGPVGEEL